MKRIRCLLVKELAQLRRDPKLFGILLVAPLLQLTILGFAADTDVKEVTMAVRDHDRTYQSREYVRALESSSYFKTFALEGAGQDEGALLVSGKAGLVLVIPKGFGEELVRSRPASVQVLVDGADNTFAVQGLNYLQKATRLYSQRQVRVVEERLARTRGVRLPKVAAESRAWFNPDLRSRFFMVPGLMGALLMVTTMIVTSMALVKEREEGTMEQIIVTPLTAGELIAGKLLPFVVVGIAEVTLAIPLMLLIFHVPLRGSVLLLYLFSALFLLSTLGIGLFISTLVRTQQQAMMMAVFFVMLPFILLSGFIFPVENMPDGIRHVAHCIPLKYYLIAVRGIFLKGTGWHDLWPSAAILLGWGIGILSLAILKFHKKLD